MKIGYRTSGPWQSSWGSTLLNFRGCYGVVSKISVTKTDLAKVDPTFFRVGDNFFNSMDEFLRLMISLKNELTPTIVDSYQVASRSNPASFNPTVEPDYTKIAPAFVAVDGKISIVILDGAGYSYRNGIDQQVICSNYTINLTKERFSDVEFEKYICFDDVTGLITKVESSKQPDKHQVYVHVKFISNDFNIAMYDTLTVTQDDATHQTLIQLDKAGEPYPVKLYYANMHVADDPDPYNKCGLYELGTNAFHFFLLSPGIPELDYEINYAVTSDYTAPEVYAKI